MIKKLILSLLIASSLHAAFEVDGQPMSMAYGVDDMGSVTVSPFHGTLLETDNQPMSYTAYGLNDMVLTLTENLQYIDITQSTFNNAPSVDTLNAWTRTCLIGLQTASLPLLDMYEKIRPQQIYSVNGIDGDFLFINQTMDSVFSFPDLQSVKTQLYEKAIHERTFQENNISQAFDLYHMLIDKVLETITTRHIKETEGYPAWPFSQYEKILMLMKDSYKAWYYVTQTTHSLQAKELNNTITKGIHDGLIPLTMVYTPQEAQNHFNHLEEVMPQLQALEKKCNDAYQASFIIHLNQKSHETLLTLSKPIEKVFHQLFPDDVSSVLLQNINKQMDLITNISAFRQVQESITCQMASFGQTIYHKTFLKVNDLLGLYLTSMLMRADLHAKGLDDAWALVDQGPLSQEVETIYKAWLYVTFKILNITISYDE